MMIPTLHLIGVSVGFCISSSLATPLPFYGFLEGSTDEEELSNFTSSLATSSLFSEYQTTPGGPTHVDVDFLKQVENFLMENMLLILVVATFVFMLFLIICGAVFMTRRRKVNAYYPSSFPSKMYVDHRDKTGGAKPFNEVPEKTTPEQKSESMDSHRQLQADIMKAAKSLRTPNKSAEVAEESDPSRKEDDHSSEDKPHGSVLDKQLPSLPEEKEQCQLSGSHDEIDSPEQVHSEKDDSQEPLVGRSVRPSSLHIHSDSATLQLIAGEKTAF